MPRAARPAWILQCAALCLLSGACNDGPLAPPAIIPIAYTEFVGTWDLEAQDTAGCGTAPVALELLIADRSVDSITMYIPYLVLTARSRWTAADHGFGPVRGSIAVVRPGFGFVALLKPGSAPEAPTAVAELKFLMSADLEISGVLHDGEEGGIGTPIFSSGTCGYRVTGRRRAAELG